MVSGPSGVGKSYLCERAVQSGFQFVVPTTSRRRRENEVDGRDYEFVSVPEFQSGVLDGSFADWDYVLGNYYGTRSLEFQNAVDSTEIYFMHALARMAIRYRATASNRVYCAFLMPGEVSEIESRLTSRSLGTEELIARRAHGDEERVHAPLFDYILEWADTREVSESLELILDAARSHWLV